MKTRSNPACATVAAQTGFDRVFIDHDIPDDVATALVGADNGRLHLPAALADAFGMSRSEARRLIAQGGVKVDGQTLPADELDVDVALVDGKVVQVGRRQFRRLQVER